MLKVLFVASELTPIAKVGGLGDVIGSLPKALANLGVDPVRGKSPKATAAAQLRASNGVDARIIIPLYEQIEKSNLKLVISNWRLGIDNEKINVYKTRLPYQHSNILQNVRMLARNDDGVEVFFVENKKYLSRGPIYFEKTAFAGSSKEIQRFVFFSKAVFSLLTIGLPNTETSDIRPPEADRLRRRTHQYWGYRMSGTSDVQKFESAIGWQPDIVHCNDWHTGALVRLLRTSGLKHRTIFTIHNLANQGAIGGTNWMAEGIKNADIVTTVSPTYAKEILTKKYGAGLENLLKKRAKEGKLIGILNGVDYSFWPVKKRNKTEFQKELGLKQNKDLPVFGLISRLTYQKGINLVMPAVEKFVEKYDAQFVFLGKGEEQREKSLAKLAKKHPRNIFTKIGFDEELAHRIYAQSDFFLMPSRFEPSGLGQMISMHYGTIPIVRATGGLKDSVQHLKTGFVFKNESAADLKKAIELAIKYFYDKQKFNAIYKNCLKQDFSWRKSAKEYKKIYLKLF